MGPAMILRIDDEAIGQRIRKTLLQSQRYEVLVAQVHTSCFHIINTPGA
jgi:hypothetical protein